MDLVCAPGYLERKRGEVARTRTTLLLAHTNALVGYLRKCWQWRVSWRTAADHQHPAVWGCKQNIPLARILLRLGGQYGDLAVVIDLLSRGLYFLTCGKDYSLLDLPVIQARLQGVPDAECIKCT